MERSKREKSLAIMITFAVYLSFIGFFAYLKINSATIFLLYFFIVMPFSNTLVRKMTGVDVFRDIFK